MVGLWAFLGIGMCVCVFVEGRRGKRGGERLLLVVKIKTRGGNSRTDFVLFLLFCFGGGVWMDVWMWGMGVVRIWSIWCERYYVSGKGWGWSTIPHMRER